METAVIFHAARGLNAAAKRAWSDGGKKVWEEELSRQPRWQPISMERERKEKGMVVVLTAVSSRGVNEEMNESMFLHVRPEGLFVPCFFCYVFRSTSSCGMNEPHRRPRLPTAGGGDILGISISRIIHEETRHFFFKAGGIEIDWTVSVVRTTCVRENTRRARRCMSCTGVPGNPCVVFVRVVCACDKMYALYCCRCVYTKRAAVSSMLVRARTVHISRLSFSCFRLVCPDVAYMVASQAVVVVCRCCTSGSSV